MIELECHHMHYIYEHMAKDLRTAIRVIELECQHMYYIYEHMTTAQRNTR